jgi:hypothetical protein
LLHAFVGGCALCRRSHSPGADRQRYGGDAAMPALFFAIFLVTTVLARRLRDRTA